MRYFISLSYDGTFFSGWQVQKNAISVQQIINECLTKLFKKPVCVVGAGRTDRGVHAVKMVAHVDLHVKIDCNKARYQLNSILDKNISINKIIEVEDALHCRFDAYLRSYIYKIHTQKNPFMNNRSLFYPYILDLELLNQAANYLLGKHDFKSFCRKLNSDINCECEVKSARFYKLNNQYIFEIQANRFVRGMVRAIVGTLLEINKNKKGPKLIKEIIESKSRKNAGPSAKPFALYLMDVRYKNLSI